MCDCYERNLRRRLVDASFVKTIDCKMCRRKLKEARLKWKRIILFKQFKKVRACYSANKFKCFGCVRGIKASFLTVHNLSIREV
jgi:hypothetical protein